MDKEWVGKELRGKGKNCWLPAFSPFPTSFSKHFLNRDCLTLYHTSPSCNNPEMEDSVRKG